jgi:hypothetical protein
VCWQAKSKQAVAIAGGRRLPVAWQRMWTVQVRGMTVAACTSGMDSERA